ncbi:hypothetical protein C2S53_006003 [Perilla frutescens var. hirtella]|uniref:non-specific serine/threonine protein kinase n=1 Tax=Perilla frutescens var. hirtella TaxID=608512 RepID=A0AAD4J297_PERFH|nr:hypothetical protein C2S53_006003 [Perilla frutescens var. hirtella]
MGKFEDTILFFLGAVSAAIWFGASASLNISSVDESSLLSIKAYINSDILASNWSKEASFCTWTGIICGKKHPERVTSLNLSNMGLRGTIAKEIGNLSFLRFVDISNNSISGLIPSEIGQLRRLRVLKMAFNQLSDGIPQSIGLLRKLQEFNLSYNYLSGNFPAGFGNCSKLQKLSLTSNYFTGKIPLSFGNSSNLEVFDISVNSFSGKIVLEMGKFSSLRRLNLQANNLSGEVPQSIFNLSMLEFLSLRENNISGTLPSSIDKGLPNIQQIFLGNIARRFILPANQFYGKIPNSISNLSKLVTLDLSDNSFTHVPMNLGNLHQLEMLNLEANQLTNNLSDSQQDFLSSLAACKNLKSVQISFNPVTGVLPKSLGSSNLSASLETLKAFSCRILDPIPNEIGNLSNLLWLSLGYNHFTGAIPTTLGRLRSLKNLEIHGNRFQGSISPVLCNLNHLYSLNLAINNLSGQLPSCLGNLSSLREIYMSRNEFNSNIASVSWFHKDASNVKNLVALDLSRNQLSGEIPSTISQLQNLVRLSLSRNKLTGSVVEFLTDLKDLQHLDLSHNNLSGRIPKSLEALSHLNYFDVSYNELSGEIPDRGCFVNFTADFFIGNKVLAIPFIGLIFFLVRKICARKPPLSEDLPYGFHFHRRISYQEILRATGNFDQENVIGRGGIGSIYKGIFSDGKVYAVKVFDLDAEDALKSFHTESEILSSVRHRNIVKIITCCSQIDFKALVMAYMPNGDLEKWLHSASCSLGLWRRLTIMTEVACAIEYLHGHCTSSILHCDLNPKNILLDEDMVSHVGDFSIAKLLKQEERILQSATLGTVGYIAPEYGSQGLISTKVDVYSYGVLLMEMLLRRKPTDEMFLGELTMRRWVSQSFPDSVLQIVDSKLLSREDGEGRAAYERCLTSVIWLALQCTEYLPEERPDMRDVLTMIREIRLKYLGNSLSITDRTEMQEIRQELGNDALHIHQKCILYYGLIVMTDEMMHDICDARTSPVTNNGQSQLRSCVTRSAPCDATTPNDHTPGQSEPCIDAYKRFLRSTRERDVGIGYGVTAQYFSDIENMNVDFEEHHINAYLAILRSNPQLAGVQKPRGRVAIVDTTFSANVQAIWMARHKNDVPGTICDTNTMEDLSSDELQILLQYVRGEQHSMDWFDCDEVIVVYNVTEHWVVCKLNLISSTVFMFDSIQHTFTNKGKEQRVVDTQPLACIVPILLKHARFWAHRRELQPRLTPWPVKIPMSLITFVQRDSHSCGPFALMYVEAILTGKIAPHGAQERISAYRRHIAHTIFRCSTTINHGSCKF